jgi:hypothetical protein
MLPSRIMAGAKGGAGRAALGAGLASLAGLLAIGLALGRPYVVGAGIVLLAWAIYRGWAAGQRGDRDARRRAAGALGGVIAACVVSAATFAAGYVTYTRYFRSSCDAAARTHTLTGRRAAWSAVRSHAWMAERLGSDDLDTCYEETLLDEVKPGGPCPDWPLDDVPCVCGGLAAKWPGDIHCGDKRAFCGCLPPGKPCSKDDDCCSGSCPAGACADGTSSSAVRTLRCVAP